MGFEVCGLHEALVKTGIGIEKPRIIIGGYCYVFPFQKLQKLDLKVMTISVNSPHVYTKQGVPVSVNSTAQIRIGTDNELIQTAAHLFLGFTPAQISKAADETLEGHQRAILGTMTVEEIFQDREKFALEVRQTAAQDLRNMGLEILSFTIRDIADTEGYLQALGKKRVAEVKRDARIGEAEAERDAGVREADALREKMAKKFEADTAVADSERKYKLQKAVFDREVNSEQAKANLAYELQKNKIQQDIKNETMEVQVVMRKKQIEVEEQEILRKQKELEATVKLPADAQSYQVQVIAEGQKIAKIKKATAEATATQSVGMAEAESIKLIGEAEADQMKSKAGAWKEYSRGAYLEMIIDQLPAMASSVADPLSKVKHITMVSTGGDDVGASRLTGEIANVLGQVNPVIEKLTGINITNEMNKL